MWIVKVLKMEILPIRSLSQEDAFIFGKLNVLLGQLIRMGLTDIEGLVVAPPEIEIKSAMQYFDLGHRELFEQSLNLAKKHLLNQAIPDEFTHAFKAKRCFLEGKVYLKTEELWHGLIDSWMYDLSQALTLPNLEAKTVCIVKKVKNYGIAYWDEINSMVVVKDALNNLKPELEESISDQVIKINKKLMLHYTYEWILEDKIKISGIINHWCDQKSEIIVKKPYELLSVTNKAVLITKIYQNLTDDIIIKEFDGVFADLKIDHGPTWFEACVPEHILNIDKYINDGIYGVVININDTLALKNLFNNFFETTRRAKIPVLVIWESLDIKFLEYLIQEGVRGVIIKRHDLDVMQDLLSKIEKKILLLGKTKK